jgi:hypothetical protein
LKDREPADRAHPSAGALHTDARTRISGSLKKAFPLPDSGTFGDILNAIDAATGPRR